MKKSRAERIDKMLTEAADAALNDLIEEYPKLEDLEGAYEFSDQHNKKMQRLFKKAKKIENGGHADAWHTFRRLSFNAAAVLCMLFTVFTLVAFSVPEIRVAITNYIVKQNEEYIVINTESNINSEETIEGAPKYIPEGFDIVSIVETEIMIDIVYESDQNKFIYYTRNVGETMLIVDNENSNFKTIDIDRYSGYISQKNNEIIIIFHDGEHTYHIASNVEQEEIIKIAVSIIK